SSDIFVINFFYAFSLETAEFTATEKTSHDGLLKSSQVAGHEVQVCRFRFYPQYDSKNHAHVLHHQPLNHLPIALHYHHSLQQLCEQSYVVRIRLPTVLSDVRRQNSHAECLLDCSLIVVVLLYC